MKIFSFLLLAFSALNFAQELNCNVSVNFESLPVVNRELLFDFEQMVENYMNNTRFTDNWTWNKIDCNLDIFILTASGEINYTAQVVVTSKREIYKSPNKSLMVTINDNQWAFQYEKGQPLYSNLGVFDPIASLLNFYAYIMIGYDMDSWEQLSGSDTFRKAFDIVNQGASSRYSNGWEKNSNSYSRRGLVEELMSEKFRPFREGFYTYHYGIDYYEQNKKIGQENIVKFINILDNLREKFSVTSSIVTKVFFDAKNGEIIEKLKDYPDKEIFTKLKKIDPGHAGKYDVAMELIN